LRISLLNSLPPSYCLGTLTPTVPYGVALKLISVVVATSLSKDYLPPHTRKTPQLSTRLCSPCKELKSHSDYRKWTKNSVLMRCGSTRPANAIKNIVHILAADDEVSK